MKELLSRISPDRIAADLWRLVNIPSPTCHEHAVLAAYADLLRAAGAEVEVIDRAPAAPLIVGRLKGGSPGPTLQFAGHADHINVPHAAPARDGDTISGRGSADMKNGLAAILEIVRVLAGCRAAFRGTVLVTAYGLHEAPDGDSAAILDLIRRRIVGDAAIVMEGVTSGEGSAVVSGKGQSVWNIALRRAGGPCHEIMRPPDADDLLATGITLLSTLRKKDAELRAATKDRPLLGAESLFIGQAHYGDFYNRAPSVMTFQGTRRWHPGHDFAFVQKELSDILAHVPRPAGLKIEANWCFVGESYEMNPAEPIVQALRGAHEAITGKPMPLAGSAVVTDANRLIPFGHVPTVLCGVDHDTAHADFEHVNIPRVATGCRIALRTALEYLNGKATI